mmetsp:Transcript_108124/g.316125  ORF Transcript_108124/g.316125 Transcript_108124/m.316125 type:complete len:352 (-) Transcript_108124:356-1411(-)
MFLALLLAVSAELASSGLVPGKFEVFSWGGNKTTVKQMDWSRLTMVKLNGPDPEAVDYVHLQGGRAIMTVHTPALNASAAEITAWATESARKMKAAEMDGIATDFEDPIAAGSFEQKVFTRMHAELARAVHAKAGLVIICVAWSPDGIDGRDYDYLGLSKVVDAFFVMGYDLASQLWDRCEASSNAGYPKVKHGLLRFLAAGIPAPKMILGVPWYGHLYPCTEAMSLTERTCQIEPAPFRGCPCSDAKAPSLAYSRIRQALLRNETSGRVWDPVQQSPYANFRHDGRVWQLWYDDAESLAAKYELARSLGLGGAGMYRGDFIAYDSRAARQDAADMWAALGGAAASRLTLV